MTLRFRCSALSIPAVLAIIILVAIARPVAAQQRPLVTEDPEPIGAGRVLIEGGVDYAHDQQYPVSGLRGDLWRAPPIGLSIGISSIAELQIDGGIYDRLHILSRDPTAPLAFLLTATGASTHSVEDVVIGTKIHVIDETA